ncbi:4-hydroxybutyrate CoA-transferase [Sphaerisporangium krabiense]|uniref:Acyl-CoA hydrolase n=1 Tax=Sphaerisporangium krabiense TaxID=763782 RepID=A0A7W8ZA46_9ACTN|nr:acetyl-CoA hydrolase/transferase family protein [Sphaerisporangium krabiense]MBB5630135.1 acyl-CoA hydrolase [Sphaerisporangium krabiense]GII65085.1 4-hydroxybutyrate CoA-transferase [Sphaerisporangium krabiense]
MGAPEDVLAHIPPGADLIVPNAAGEPVTLLDTLEAHAGRLDGVRIHRMDPRRERAYIRGEFGDRLRHVDYFLGPGSRRAYWDGGCDLVPAHFSEAAMLMRATTKCTLALASVSPPDRHGYVSMGTNADYTASFIGDIPFFVEVNPNMPYTSGENQIKLADVAGWCHSEAPLPELERTRPDERDTAIAAHIAGRVPDGACLQIGVGRVPSALPAALSGHRDLGVHTEVLSDGIMELVEKGVVTGARKRHFRNKHVATFAIGTRRLYDWLDHNGAVAMMPAAWVNSPRTVAREPGTVSVNATSEVDLLGQAASETIAGRYWSGSGGQSDFARGAMYSEGGQGFLVLHATTGDGRSRINLRLTPGSVVTTLKNTVDNVVTEYGVAELRGRTMAERAAALIGIAHPGHRDRLRHEARHAGLLR